jgi:hypothetical protein
MVNLVLNAAGVTQEEAIGAISYLHNPSLNVNAYHPFSTLSCLIKK